MREVCSAICSMVEADERIPNKFGILIVVERISMFY
jgi:hypothetical protein